MKIVFSHSGVLPVLGYGGIERIVFWHMAELARMGHKVVLIGHPDSRVALSSLPSKVIFPVSGLTTFPRMQTSSI
jgi:hypothetical protein